MTTNSIFLIKHCQFVMKYGISLMDPKVVYFNKLCLRYHSKELFLINKPEFLKKEINKKNNIYDITSRQMFYKYLLKAIKNKIHVNININNKVDERKALGSILRYIK